MLLRRFVCPLAFCFALGPPIFAQSRSGPFTINSSSSPCASINVLGQATVGIQVTGTFSATLQPEVSVQGQTPQNTQVTPSTSSTGQATITAAGTYVSGVGGYDTFLVCVSSYASGTATIYLNASPAPNASLFGNGGIASSVPFSGVGASTNANTLVEGGLGSLSPSGSATIAGSEEWIGGGIPDAGLTFTDAQTGGTLVFGDIVYMEVTLNSVLGQTTPTKEFNVRLDTNCTSGSACSLTVTPPTVVSSAFTGWTLYDTLSTGVEKEQNALSNCVNLSFSTNCVIGTIAAGPSPPTQNASILQPPNVQTSLCSWSILPTTFELKADGNNYPYGGMDFSNDPILPTPKGTLTFCDRLFITDSKTSIEDETQANGGPIRNALVSISSNGNSTTQSSSTDDRVIAVRGVDSAINPAYSQFLGYYGEQFIYNNAFSCENASPLGEDCAAGIRIDMEDNRTAGTNAISDLVAAHFSAGTTNASPNFSCGSGPCVSGVIGSAGQSVTPNVAGANSYAGVVGVVNSSGTNNNSTAYDFWAYPPSSLFSFAEGALFIPTGFSSSHANDYAIRSVATAKSQFNGIFWLGGGPGGAVVPVITTDATSALGIMGSIAQTNGSLSTGQITALTTGQITLVLIGTGNSLTYTYAVCSVDGNGGEVCSATKSVTNGPTTLSATNFIEVQIPNPIGIQGPVAWRIYRTVCPGSGGVCGTGGATGLIGTFSAQTDMLAAGTAPQDFLDQGATGDGTTLPVGNSTGSVKGALFETSSNCKVNSTSPATCGAAAAGTVVVPTTTTTYAVDTTAITANSEILLQYTTDATGLPSSPTCVVPSTLGDVVPSARTAGTSFTFTLPSTTGTVCVHYFLVN
jgi:hypothetical protein